MTERTAFYRSLGGWIVAKRRALRLSQASLGEVFGVGGDAVSRWENGRVAIDAYVPHAMKQMLREKGLPTK